MRFTEKVIKTQTAKQGFSKKIARLKRKMKFWQRQAFFCNKLWESSKNLRMKFIDKKTDELIKFVEKALYQMVSL